MSGDTALAFIPTEQLLRARAEHNLPYINNRFYDYTYGDFLLIPYAMATWLEDGIDLSPDFVDRCWRDFANKREGMKAGERNRTCKLLLDAVKAMYDHAAFAEYAGCQVLYRPSDDAAGKDLRVYVPDVGHVWLQMRVEIRGNYSDIKRRRQVRRGQDTCGALDCCAYEIDVDTSAQPWLPKPDWYVNTIRHIRTSHLLVGDLDLPA